MTPTQQYPRQPGEMLATWIGPSRSLVDWPPGSRMCVKPAGREQGMRTFTCRELGRLGPTLVGAPAHLLSLG